MEDIDARIKDLEKRVSDGIAASNFSKSAEGNLILTWVEERINQLLNRVIGSKPLDDREYLAAHGAIKELQNIITMLQSKSTALAANQEELNVLRQDTGAGKS